MSIELRKELILEGLDCASCADKIEVKLRKLDNIRSASLNFATKTLLVELEDKGQRQKTLSMIEDLVHKLEPHVIIREKASHKGKNKNDYGTSQNKRRLIRLAMGGLLFALAIISRQDGPAKFLLYFTSYLLVGGEILLRAGRNIFRGQIFDENFLMAIATVGAFAIGEFPEGVAVMLFYQLGEFFQDLAVNRSRKSIAKLMDIRPDYANLKTSQGEKRVSPEEVKVGDLIIIKPGERVPLDGIVVEGASMVDTSALTGESMPREVGVGTSILSGFINKNALLIIRVDKEFGESTVTKILELVENASSKKASAEKFITRFARYYTPFVVFSALALAIIPPLLIEGAEFSQWIYRALVFLVISCPCALVISIPLAFFGGIGGASRNGILVKGGNYLEALNHVDMVVFDKTGTLTRGVFQVTQINPAGGVKEEELLDYAAHAEAYSNHPIALSILKAHGREIDKTRIENYEEVLGHGIRVNIDGRKVLAGNAKLMDREDIAYRPVDAIGTVIYIGVNNQFMGSILISDEIKKDAQKTIDQLNNLGIKETIMLTGDNDQVGMAVGKELGLSRVYAQLLPDQKVKKLEELEKDRDARGQLVFVGDGINDAPVLARADIGVAMGALGSDAAIEAADVVLMTDEPYKLVRAMEIAKKTRKIVWQNIIFAFAVKALVLFLGAGGLATMWEAVFADVGVALIAVLNSMRVLRI